MKKCIFVILCFCLPSLGYALDACRVESMCAHLQAVRDELHACCDESAVVSQQRCDCWGSLEVYGEYVWWKVFQDDLHYAISGVQNNVPSAGNLNRFDGQWESGFRVGASMILPCYAWRLGGEWLRLRSNASDHVVEGDLVLRATRGQPMNVDVIDQALASFDLKLDTVRLNVEMPLCQNACVVLTPIVGLRADFISEDFAITYVTPDATFDNRMQYWGVGPEVGLDLSWYVLPCFSFFGRPSVGTLYGSCGIHQEQFRAGANEDVNVRSRMDRLQPVFATTIGMQWEKLVCKCLHINLGLAWESNVWIDLNTTLLYFHQGIEGALTETEGNLYTSGITARAGLAF